MDGGTWLFQFCERLLYPMFSMHKANGEEFASVRGCDIRLEIITHKGSLFRLEIQACKRDIDEFILPRLSHADQRQAHSQNNHAVASVGSYPIVSQRDHL